MRRSAVALVALLVGCDAAHVGLESDAGTDAPQLDAGPAFGDVATEFCAPMAHLWCSHAAQCGCASSLPGGAFDASACEENWARLCLRENAPGIASGGQVILASMHACLDRLAARDPCDAIDLADCGLLVGIPSASGSTCVELASCGAGEEICLDGFCQPLPHAGDPCNMGLCADGLWCDFTAESCAPRVPVGGACSDSRACVVPARCSAGRCVVSIPEGGACLRTDDCAANLACIGGLCATASDDCGAGCGRSATCVLPQTCQPPIAIGEPCPDDASCGPAARCDERTQTCVSRPGLGEACGITLDCGPGATCVGSTPSTFVCVALGQLGDACGSAGRVWCADSLACVGGACATPPPIGSPCGEDSICALDASCSAGTCVARGAEGESCNGETCASGLECDYGASTCVRAPALGEVCFVVDDLCPCLPDASGLDTCQTERVEGDPCGSGAACPTGLVCRASGPGRCVAAACAP